MQQWEYLFVEAEGAWTPRVHYVNHKEVEHWRDGPLLVDYMNHLGSEGWELVSYDNYGQVLVFKRPKPA